MSSTLRRGMSAACLVIALALVVPGSALATPPGANGRITYMQFDDNGQFQVWVANPDLTGQTQITPGTSDGWMPGWSPDGSRIVFASHRDDPDPNDAVEIMDVFTMRPDGSDVRKLTDSVGYSGSASWSPDGRWIVYSADRADYPSAQGIYIIPSDGSAPPRRITTLPAGSSWQELPRFSPDGSRLVFNEYRGGKVLRNHRDGASSPSSRPCSRCVPTEPTSARSPRGGSTPRTRTGRRTASGWCSGRSPRTSATSAT